MAYTASGRHVADGKYTLRVGVGSAKIKLLRGSLHVYASSGPKISYRLINHLFVGFVGDDTTSASAEFQIAHVEVSGPQQAGTPEGHK